MKKINKGFTIIEILLYIGLLSIFLIILTTIFFEGINLKLDSQATSSVQIDGQFILARFMYDINNADNMTVVNSQTLDFTNNGVSYSYSIDGNNNLILNSGGQPSDINGTDSKITNLNFTQVGNPGGKSTVQISYTLQSRVVRPGNVVEKQDFQETVGLR